MSSSYSTELAGIIRNFLDHDDWHYAFLEDCGIFRFGYSIPCQIKKVDVIIDVKDDAFVTYVICPLSPELKDEHQMLEMVKFLTMANYGLLNGNWEFDFTDGEIRYKVFVNCEGVKPSYEVIKASIGCPAAMYHRYAPGILQILLNGKSAEEVIRECESDLPRRPAAEPEDTEDTDDEDDSLPEGDDFDEETDDFVMDGDLEEQAARLLEMLHSFRPETE